MNEYVTVSTTMIIYIIMAIGNHATKCTNALMYDATLISMVAIFVFLVFYLWRY